MKKVLSFFLGIITCCLITFCAFAADNTDNIPSDAEVQAYASNFMTASQKNDNIGINEFIHLYSPDGTLTGYYVTFINNEDPAGYVLLSLISGEDPIVEFSFEGTGPITSAETEAVATTSAVFDEPEQDSAILYTGAGEIFIPTQEGTLYSVYDHEYVSADAEVATYSSGTDKVKLENGIINWSQANIDNNSVKKIAAFGAGTDYWLMKQFSDGGVCTPTAETNILWYWGFQRNCSSIKNKVSSYSTRKQKATAIFNTVFSAMGTSTKNGTLDSKILTGYKSILGKSTGSTTWNYRSIPNGSSYKTYTTALNDDCPIHLVLHANDADNDKGSGHCVMTLGYAKSTSGAKYLFVMDGWNNYGRFVKFNYYPYFFGYKIWVA